MDTGLDEDYDGSIVSNVLIVDSSDLEGAIEGTGSTAMEIAEMEPLNFSNDGNEGEMSMEPGPPGTSTSLEEDGEEGDAETITKRNQDIRKVTSQFIHGDLTCTEYASAIDGLVHNSTGENNETEAANLDPEVAMDPNVKAVLDSPEKDFDRQDQLGDLSSVTTSAAVLESAITTSLSQILNKRKNSNAGFYGSGTTPSTFTIFRKKKLSTTLQRLIGAAHVRYAQGDHQSAIEMCMEIIKEQPTCIEPFQTLSMIYESGGRSKKSLQFALIAGLLSPRTCTEWPKLGEMSLEDGNFPQAIMCYAKATQVEPKNPLLFKRRCELMEMYGDVRGALRSYSKILVVFPDHCAMCIDILRKMARIYFDHGDILKAHETLTVAFNEQYKEHITTEEINLMLELSISLKKYVEAFDIMLGLAGVEIYPPIDRLAFESRITLTKSLKSEDIVCHVPSSLNVELLAKLIGVLIHLEAFHLSEKLVEKLKISDPETFGDLYLDVAEAYMSKQNYGLAITVLVPLINSIKFSVAAVWLRYAECLFLLQRLEEAARAYEKVVNLAPNHTLAKLNLSIILQRLGRSDDALETLVTAEKDLDPIDPCLMIERCNILLKSRRITEFIQTAKLLLSRHCPQIRNIDEALVIVMATNKTRKRHEAVQIDRRMRGEPIEEDVPNFLDKETDPISEWKIYLQLCKLLVSMERFDLLSSVAYSACGSTLFSKNYKMESACEMHCFYASLMCDDPTLLPHNVRIMLSRYPYSRRILNMFSMTMQRSESDTRFQRHVLRMLMKRPNDIRLMLLNAHTSFVTGTYKNALMEYTTLFTETPNNPIIPLMISSCLLQVLTQKTSTNRAQLSSGIIAFMKKYLELRGDCQEAFYNMARAMHFLGFLPLAIQYYKRVLVTKPVRPKKKQDIILLGNENTMDLTQEAAFNLAQLYRSHGSPQLARYYLYTYVRI